MLNKHAEGSLEADKIADFIARSNEEWFSNQRRGGGVCLTT
jgi:hypothetical protein